MFSFLVSYFPIRFIQCSSNKYIMSVLLLSTTSACPHITVNAGIYSKSDIILSCPSSLLIASQVKNVKLIVPPIIKSQVNNVTYMNLERYPGHNDLAAATLDQQLPQPRLRHTRFVRGAESPQFHRRSSYAFTSHWLLNWNRGENRSYNARSDIKHNSRHQNSPVAFGTAEEEETGTSLRGQWITVRGARRPSATVDEESA